MTIYEDEIDLRPYINAIVKNWWKIGLLAFALALFVFIFTRLQAYSYQATATILVPHSQLKLSLTNQFPTIDVGDEQAEAAIGQVEHELGPVDIDPAGDVPLDVEEITGLVCVGLCPQVFVVIRVDQLGIDSQQFTGFPDTALENMTHIQAPGDLEHLVVAGQLSKDAQVGTDAEDERLPGQTHGDQVVTSRDLVKRRQQLLPNAIAVVDDLADPRQ